ncbi:outer membrane scaffolding protein for murein synthesis (MipA/OmpV family) [Pelomonas saccharophila]|uniref:Outer membrane scaffolding protein for murein synthesis (MipA/OmpV family) n=1 Tax=Roseateles saccharophilus TaxID=304 RepID=A0ABU1YX41_ROSSA|nr:MipA/OmpV family protein [Roseateles saccharophilus]MDR7272591.1 outer membrane scaffolding protein for murein synthesis (MipA/OmpV family) [Roseateles saccharophilus]
MLARPGLSLCILSSFLLAAPNCRADDEAPQTPTASNWLVGAMALSQPEYEGSDRRIVKLRPLWAYQWGRFRISTSRAGGVMNFASDPQGPGASALLLSSDQFRLGAALRFDSGRTSGDSEHLKGLPDVKRTLRGRFFASWKLAERWDLSGNISQDLLGRRGGAVGSVDLGYHQRVTERTEWSASVGASLASAQNMRTYFGVTPEQSVASGLPAFSPGAGARDVYGGLGFTTALTPRWILFGNAGVSRLVGDAAASPLTQQRSSFSAGVGLAYRCCRW